jgi:hypothetical protein
MRTDPLKWAALTGERLNALVAEHVMGLKLAHARVAWTPADWATSDTPTERNVLAIVTDAWQPGSDFPPALVIPNYCGDWNRIRDIAEKLRAECFELRTNMCLGGYGATFRADWETGAITPIRATHYDDDLAVAVCRAALDVKGYTP